jgi:hypothetical protein
MSSPGLSMNPGPPISGFNLARQPAVLLGAEHILGIIEKRVEAVRASFEAELADYRAKLDNLSTLEVRNEELQVALRDKQEEFRALKQHSQNQEEHIADLERTVQDLSTANEALTRITQEQAQAAARPSIQIPDSQSRDMQAPSEPSPVNTHFHGSGGSDRFSPRFESLFSAFDATSPSPRLPLSPVTRTDRDDTVGTSTSVPEADMYFAPPSPLTPMDTSLAPSRVPSPPPEKPTVRKLRAQVSKLKAEKAKLEKANADLTKRAQNSQPTQSAGTSAGSSRTLVIADDSRIRYLKKQMASAQKSNIEKDGIIENLLESFGVCYNKNGELEFTREGFEIAAAINRATSFRDSTPEVRFHAYIQM